MGKERCESGWVGLLNVPSSALVPEERKYVCPNIGLERTLKDIAKVMKKLGSG